MNREGMKGSVTIFFSITSILFLSLICAAAESARIQGAKTQTANIMGMGNFSLLSEYENALLDRYDIFALNSTYGSGTFQIQKAEERLEGFLSDNANPKKDFLSALCFDPWNLSLRTCEIEGYTLLTDEDGEAFYQQAAAYMKDNLGALAIDQLLKYEQDAQTVKKWQEQYEEQKNSNDSELENLEEQKNQKLQSLESEAEDAGEIIVAEPQRNPLDEIAKLRKKSILEIVTWNQPISGKEIKRSELPSARWLRSGTLDPIKKESGLLANLLFREYLLMHFPNYTEKEADSVLEYQIEYLLGGKSKDEDNLDYVAKRLLLLREGMNYLYCTQNEQMSAEAGSLALSLTGFLGIPALTTATKHALLFAWAYGESLIDVRILLDQGGIPLWKDSTSWNLSLENLGRLTDILKQGSSGEEEGMRYLDYLRILLNLGSLKKQKMRALDLIQAQLQQEEQTAQFKAEDCIVAVKTRSVWNCHPVFFNLVNAVMGISAETITFEQHGSISY